MARSSILDLLLLEQAQAQAHIPVNEAIQALERAGCGYQAVDVSSGDTTLTPTQTQFHFIRLYGTPSADYNVTVDGNNRIFVLQNETSHVATIKTDGTGNTVDVYPKQVVAVSLVGDDVYQLADLVPQIVKDVSDIGDWDNVIDSGFCRGTSMANKPSGSGYWQYGIVLRHDASNFILQIVSDFGSSQLGDEAIWYRHKDNGTWSSWQKLAVSASSTDVDAEDVAAGDFAANRGGGDFSFPSKLLVGGTGTPNGTIDVNGSIVLKRTATASDYTVASDDYMVAVTDTSVARTITLPSAGTIEGRVVVVKDESGGAATNNITVTTEGSETIDGASSQAITTNYGVLRLYSDGSNWFKV